MIIAAHIFAASLSQSGLYNSLLLLARQQPSISFIFLLDEKLVIDTDLPDNISLVKVDAPKNGLTLRYWCTIKMPALLKKYKASHFISETGAIGSRINIPQFIFLNSAAFLQKKPFIAQPYSKYLNKNFSEFIEKASGIFVAENFIADAVTKQYREAASKIRLVRHGLNAGFKPVNWEEKEQFLETFSDGTEYFIAECSVLTRQNILSLLKAFSLFKKRQKSSMKLALVLKELSLQDCIKDFHLYKYRSDVIVVPYTNEETYAKILAACYAAVYLPVQIIAGPGGIDALASGTALVTFKSTAAESIYKDAALYADLTEQSVADKMMLLYKDEALRKSIIEKGLQISSQYTWTLAANEVWQALKANP
ncbi:MAG: hypothetical protein EOP53_11275 [Sphingobacteriales bacterium]|nr:MAG: hypothetical protein EOP53_11275 [Sphingobacteriales bacterium]